MDNPGVYRRGPHITEIPLQTISRLAPFSALIISIIFVIYFLFHLNILEKFLLQRMYGDAYTTLSEKNRRGFINHHMAGAVKLLIMIIALYPFVDVTFGNANFHTPFTGSKYVIKGDIMVVAMQMLIATYVFDLFYRSTISPVSAAHHIGCIIIEQSAIAMSLNLESERDATIEFVMCTVWGAFDLVSEFSPHVAIILYRLYPTSHVFLQKVFCITCFATLTGTVSETIVVMYLFGTLWDRWELSFKVATPVLHIVFASAQLWGSWIFYQMYEAQGEKIKHCEERK